MVSLTGLPSKGNSSLLLLAGIVFLTCLSPTETTKSSCFEDPSQPKCKDANTFYPEDAVQGDIDSLCDMMPWMSSCSVQSRCKEGAATGRFCTKWSILAGACSTKWGEDMSSMSGCKNYTALCVQHPGTVVQQCSEEGIPNQVPTVQAIDDVIKLCHAMPDMHQCAECTSNVMPSKNCPHPLETLSEICLSMEMSDCGHWSKMCESYPEGLSSFCGDSDGQCSGIMQMYFHNGLQDYILFKWWVPCTHFKYWMSCVVTALMSILVSFIKALRSQMDFKIRVRDFEKRQSAPPSRNVSRGTTPRNATATNADPLTDRMLERGESNDADVPMEHLSQSAQMHRGSLTRSELDPPDYILPPNGEILRGNMVRAAFLGVTMTLDYSLMLIAMTFNYGLVASVVIGAMIGAVLFGHNGRMGPSMGERACCDNS